VERRRLGRFGGLTSQQRHFPLRGIGQGEIRLYFDQVLVRTVLGFLPLGRIREPIPLARRPPTGQTNPMPRTARATPGGFCYHALNRGNRRAEVFHSDADYDAFVGLLADAAARFPVRLLAFCLMPNHFHLAVWPPGDADLSAYMHWLLTTHARRYQRHYRTSGHVWQGRFRCFPVQEDEHLLTVLRYIERNPLRAGLVAQAQDWRWSSLRWHLQPPQLPFLHPGPVPRPPDWAAPVQAPHTDAELAALRHCAARGAPFGTEAWVGPTAAQLGLEYTLRPRGRPPGRRALTEARSPSLFDKAAEGTG
jgi:putative transposase